MKHFILGLVLLAGQHLCAQDNLLQSGPMVGYSTMREVALWVQTKGETTVYYRFWDENKPETVYQSAAFVTTKDQYFTCTIKIAPLEPGIHYIYQLYLNGEQVERPYPLEFQTQTLWQWHSDPPEFTFAFGSCLYINDKKYDRPNNTYGGNYEILTSIYNQHPDFMLWDGDNTYLREADWNSETGIVYRYTHDRALPEMQALLGSVHNYAIWDDHDYGPNDSDKRFWNKDISEKVFNLFWANPNTNQTGMGGITGTFQWADCQFFLLDDRWFRSPNKYNGPGKVMFGDAQLNWLLDALQFSQASFKFIVSGGQILNPAAIYETYATFPEERQKLLDEIEKRDIKGVIFLTGDRHLTELTKMPRKDHYPLYDLTVSPLTSGPNTHTNEGNTLQVPGTLLNERNFSILRISGKRTDRILDITTYTVTGEKRWHYQIKASEIR